MKTLALIALLSPLSSFALDTSMYNLTPDQQKIVTPTHRAPKQVNFQTTTVGNTSYTNGSDSEGNQVHCRTMKAGDIVQTFCD